MLYRHSTVLVCALSTFSLLICGCGKMVTGMGSSMSGHNSRLEINCTDAEGTLGRAVCAELAEFNRSVEPLSGTLLVRKGAERFVKGVNRANDELGTDNGPDTMYLLASISKSFVAAATLKLVELGKLRLDQSVAQLVPELTRLDQVQVRHLLNQTSGLRDYGGENSVLDRQDRGEPIRMADILKIIDVAPRAPGSSFEYCNTNYLLLGEIIRRVTGLGYAEFMRRTFFEPLGMTHTRVFATEPVPTRLTGVVGYDRSIRRRPANFNVALSAMVDMYVEDMFTDGNIFSTVGDLQTWVETMSGLGDDLGLQRASKALLFTVQPHTDTHSHERLSGVTFHYGYGWFLASDPARGLVYDVNGGWASFEGQVRRYPAKDLTVVWLSNQAMEISSNLEGLIDRISAAALR